MFKPVVYAAALAAGIPASTLLTGPKVAPARPEETLPAATGDGEDDAEEPYRPADHVSEDEALDLRTSLARSSGCTGSPACPVERCWPS